MTLGDLATPLVRAGAQLVGDASLAVLAVRSDSREVEPGDIYVAVRGMRADGHAFIPQAIERGAVAIVVERRLDAPVAQLIVPDTAVALGVLVGRSLGDPVRAMTLVGVTGTNGKTTTTYLVESILAAAGARPGVLGTVEYRWRDAAGARHTVDAPFTTPTPQILHRTFAAMRDAGCTHVVMEVSSGALSMHRLAGVSFDVAAFSNLTQDHLDVHGTMAAYRDAKRMLFAEHTSARGTAVVNVDDPEGAGMAAAAPGRVLRVTAASAQTATTATTAGTASAAPGDIRVVEHTSTIRGVTAQIATPRGLLAVRSAALIGDYNVANLALAVGITEALGVAHEAIARGIAELAGVPGRVERVANPAELDIFVDYAHTPDALHNVLSALRPLTRRRLICVFGAGGDRDPTKRPKMAAEVARLADLAVVTSDNPRTEDPRAILDGILAGIVRPFAVDVDRARAIRAAITEAVPGDVVVIAGKGHETYQILGTTRHHFDDREVALEAIATREHTRLARIAGDVGTATDPDHAATPIRRVVIDSRIAAPGDLYVAIRGEHHDGHAFAAAAVAAGAAAVMVDHPVDAAVDAAIDAAVDAAVGAAAPAIVVGDTRRALGEIAHAHRGRWHGRLIAITGSAGKTTTKELTRAALTLAGPTHAADGSLNNETGVPLTLLGLRGFHAYGVVEMGMRGAGQIEYLTRLAEPDVAVVVNAGTAHIELLGSTQAIAAAKAEIWLGLAGGGTIVRPAGDDRLAQLALRHRPGARQLTFGEPGADVALVDYQPTRTGGALTLDVVVDGSRQRRELALGLVGRHTAIDACAALAAALAAGAGLDDALRGLAHARPAAMRGELVDVAGRTIIVDCYNANPASMAAALRTLAERATGHSALAVVGDMLELGSHAAAAHKDVGALARQLGLGVIALGDHAATVAAAAGGDAETAATPASAAARALARTRPGDWILLKASRGMRLERVLDAIKQAT